MPQYRLYPSDQPQSQTPAKPEGGSPTAPSHRARGEQQTAHAAADTALPPLDSDADADADDGRVSRSGATAATNNEPLVYDLHDRYTAGPAYQDRPRHACAPEQPHSKPKSASDRPFSLGFVDFDDVPDTPRSDSAAVAGPTADGLKGDGRRAPARTRGGPQHQRAASDGWPAAVRKPSASRRSMAASTTPDRSPPRAYARCDWSSAESFGSQDTAATSTHTAPSLHAKGPPDGGALQLKEPTTDDRPGSYNLVAPAEESQNAGMHSLERRAQLLFSAEHLQAIFDDPRLLLQFIGFLNTHRPHSIPILIYYLDALKALRAIEYANAMARTLRPVTGHSFTHVAAEATRNTTLEAKAHDAFTVLVQEDLPAYIAHTWTHVVSVRIQRRVTGTLPPRLHDASEGLGEVFCVTDPSRPDNPIVFASEEFTRATQYGMGYIIGRNGRFLQGPGTSAHAVRRLAAACADGKEHTELLVNYRRDGSPFMNLLMIAPLMDFRGHIRYFIGAQVDVSSLATDCSDLDGLQKLVEWEQDPGAAARANGDQKDPFQSLSEMFNKAELETSRKYGGRMHECMDDGGTANTPRSRPRLVLKDSSQGGFDRQPGFASSPRWAFNAGLNGKLQGVYQHYVLVRPAPSLRVLFASASFREPGILQSQFLHRIGGSHCVRSDLAAALDDGRSVTAKIRWLAKPHENGDGEGRPRWIHCTPLLGHSGAVGVWMVVVVDDDEDDADAAGPRGGDSGGRRSSARRFRPAPPVAANIAGKERDGNAHPSRHQELKSAPDKEQNEPRVTRGGGGSARAHKPEPDVSVSAGDGPGAGAHKRDPDHSVRVEGGRGARAHKPDPDHSVPVEGGSGARAHKRDPDHSVPVGGGRGARAHKRDPDHSVPVGGGRGARADKPDADDSVPAGGGSGASATTKYSHIANQVSRAASRLGAAAQWKRQHAGSDARVRNGDPADRVSRTIVPTEDPRKLMLY